MKRSILLLAAALFALVSVAYAGEREAGMKELEAFLAQRPLPAKFVTDAKALYQALCDNEVAAPKAEKLVEKTVQKDPAIIEDILKFVKESKEKGEKLAKAVAEKIEKSS